MLDEFLHAYLAAALWSSQEGDVPIDRDYSVDDLSSRAFRDATLECQQFLDKGSIWIVDKYFKHVTKEHTTVSQAGHDFWLTRAGHGCGFWDGDWREPAATILTNLSTSFGANALYVGDDDKLYFMTNPKGE